MSVVIPLAILAFFISPFALAGFRRAWRVAVAVWLLLGVYTALLGFHPIPSYYDEQDQLGAAAWKAIVSVVLAGGALGFGAGFAVSAMLARHRRGRRQ